MPDRLDRFTTLIRRKLVGCYPPLPSAPIMRQLVEIAYLATLKTEEGRFIRGSLTFADPANPEPDPPIIRRATYPEFTRFGRRISLSVESLVKLARAIDKWSGSIAVFGTDKSHIYAWGVADQLLHQNVRLNREGHNGAPNPGVFTITMEGPSELIVYHRDLFVMRLQQDRIVSSEYDALKSFFLYSRITPYFKPIAKQIAQVTNPDVTMREIAANFQLRWAETIARLCIGLRRLGTGGTFLISPKPVMKCLDINYPFAYRRLRDGIILGLVDQEYLSTTRSRIPDGAEHISSQLVDDLEFAGADLEDRELETSGAVKLVTALAALDGALLLTPILEVIAFGVKIRSDSNIGKVYDGEAFVSRRSASKQIDISRLGTRHTSVLRYCKADPLAIGVIVSQDGHVRLAATIGRSLVLWQQVRLLGYADNARRYIRNERNVRQYRDGVRHETTLGYGPMPKTFDALMRL